MRHFNQGEYRLGTNSQSQLKKQIDEQTELTSRLTREEEKLSIDYWMIDSKRLDKLKKESTKAWYTSLRMDLDEWIVCNPLNDFRLSPFPFAPNVSSFFLFFFFFFFFSPPYHDYLTLSNSFPLEITLSRRRIHSLSLSVSTRFAQLMTRFHWASFDRLLSNRSNSEIQNYSIFFFFFKQLWPIVLSILEGYT